MKKAIIIALAILAMMFAEYRIIMHNIRPYTENGGTVYMEVFGIVNTYYAAPVSER